MRFVKLPIVDFNFNDPRVVVDLDLDKIIYYRPFRPYEHSTETTMIMVIGDKNINVEMPYAEFDKLIKYL